jgi:hypothetical protein
MVASEKVPRKKRKPGATKQLNVRVPADLAERLEDTAEALGTDLSSLIRMVLVEHLGEYEERVRRARGEGRGDE